MTSALSIVQRGCRALAASLLLIATPLAAQTPPSPIVPISPLATPLTTASVPAVAELSSVPVPEIAATAWISLDANSGQVIATHNPDVPVEPASLTKVMTIYLTFMALDEGRVQLDQQVPVSEAAWRTGGSRMFIEPRKPVTIEQLLQGVIVQSGN